jgi:hypothetical protein
MKLIKTILVIIVFCVAVSVFAGCCGYLNNSVQTKTQSTNIISAPINLTIAKLNNSGVEYLNKTVEISGSVTALKYNSDGTYLIELREGDSRIDCIANKPPKVMLNSKISITGAYDGDKIAVVFLEFKNSFSNFMFRG